MMSYLGIDIGGSGIKGALVDVETGQLLTERRRLPTPEKAKPNDCAEVVRELVWISNIQRDRRFFGCCPAWRRQNSSECSQKRIGTNINLLLNEVLTAALITQ